jgi:hypothetical protein
MDTIGPSRSLLRLSTISMVPETSGKGANDMAISGIGSTSGVGTSQVTVNVGRKTGGSAPTGAKPSSSSSSSQSTSTSATDTYEDADTNKDGVVTAVEQATYDLKHPGAQTGTTVDVKV